MPNKLYKKKTVNVSVFDLALERLRLCFRRFDKVVVSFSGGKDSTVCLNLALEVAREVGRLPLEAIFFDEEAVPPETIEYVARVRRIAAIRLQWLCIPIQHRNACSRRSPWWYPWAPEDRQKWCRELPAHAITEVKGFNRQALPESVGHILPPSLGTVCQVQGIRTQESMTRYCAIAQKQGNEAYLSKHHQFPHITNAYPIYDWTHDDVWLAPDRFGWDYNRAYDLMSKAGIPVSQQRCAPPFGEQPIRRLWSYKQCWPELWAKMVDRVPGAATAARYANTTLYGYGGKDYTKPDGQTWRNVTYDALVKIDAQRRRKVAQQIMFMVRKHRLYTQDPIPDEVPHDRSGISWKDISKIAVIGGLKGNRQMVKVNVQATNRRKANEKKANQAAAG